MKAILIVFFSLVTIIASAQSLTSVQRDLAAKSLSEVAYKNEEYTNLNQAEIKVKYANGVEYVEIKNNKNSREEYTLYNDSLYEYTFQIDNGFVKIQCFDGQLMYSRYTGNMSEYISENTAITEDQVAIIKKAKLKLEKGQQRAMQIKQELLLQIYKCLGEKPKKENEYIKYVYDKEGNCNLAFLQKGNSPTYKTIMENKRKLDQTEKLKELE